MTAPGSNGVASRTPSFWHRTILGTALVSLSMGCLPASRLNSDCRWNGDTPGPLDLSLSDDETHIRQDVLIAEELGVRHADATVRPPRVAAREACIARVAIQIGDAHNLSTDVVMAQRGRRDWRVDAAFLLVCALAYGVAARRVSDWIAQRFSGSPTAQWLAVAGAALPIAVLAVSIGELAAMVAEGARVANLGHLSGFRGARIPWKHHRGELMTGAVILFWMVAVARTTTADGVPADPKRPDP